MAELAPQAFIARCHCGALSACYQTSVPVSLWSVRACQCAFCRAHNALSVSDLAGQLEFSASRPDRLQRYRFGSGLTDFLICRECGVYVGARLSAERFGIINAHALVPIPVELPAPEPMDYGSDSASDKKERRKSRWTPLRASSL